jgi:hypothetical protein
VHFLNFSLKPTFKTRHILYWKQYGVFQNRWWKQKSGQSRQSNPNGNINGPTGEEKSEWNSGTCTGSWYIPPEHQMASYPRREPSSVMLSLLRELKSHNIVQLLPWRIWQQVPLKHWYPAEGCQLWCSPLWHSKISYDLVNTTHSLPRPSFQVGYYRTLPPHIRIFKVFLFWRIHSLNYDSSFNWLVKIHNFIVPEFKMQFQTFYTFLTFTVCIFMNVIL